MGDLAIIVEFLMDEKAEFVSVFVGILLLLVRALSRGSRGCEEEWRAEIVERRQRDEESDD